MSETLQAHPYADRFPMLPDDELHEDEDLPTWKELFGSIPEITNGLSVNEYLDALRDEEDEA